MGKKQGGQMMKKKVLVDDGGDDVRTWWWLVHKGITVSFMCISVFALLVRAAVSLHSYSGAGNPPKFGDYEAQRHWMEITINLPAEEWYRNSTVNDLNYWGLDYPPLTAYQSYIHGLLLRSFYPQSVSLFTSRGHESYFGKLLMRWTVLSSDALIFFPAVLCFVLVYHGSRPRYPKTDIAWHIAMILLNPCLILIDHGHFQSSLIRSLSLAPSSVLPSITSSHLLGKCLKRKYPLLEVAKLGLTVVITFAVVWWPYLHSVDGFLEVLSRLAPFERGIYEDYVANFWCSTSVLIKWKRLFTMQSLKFLSLAATVLTCLPSMVHQVMAPSSEGFLYGLLNSSFAFYLFSFQVHEKSILLPLLAASLLALKLPHPFRWLTHYALFSMFPLLCRDKLLLPYIAISALSFLVYHAPGGPVGRRNTNDTNFLASLPPPLATLFDILYLCSIVLHVVYLTIRPPKKYPFLFEAVIMLLCFGHFTLFTLFANLKQWTLPRVPTSTDKEKKVL